MIKRPAYWIRQLYGFFKRRVPFDKLISHIGPANASIEQLDYDGEPHGCQYDINYYRHHSLEYLINNEVSLAHAQDERNEKKEVSAVSTSTIIWI